MRHPLLQKYDRLIEFFGQMLGQDYELSLFDLRAEGCPLIFIAGGVIVMTLLLANFLLPLLAPNRNKDTSTEMTEITIEVLRRTVEELTGRVTPDNRRAVLMVIDSYTKRITRLKQRTGEIDPQGYMRLQIDALNWEKEYVKNRLAGALRSRRIRPGTAPRTIWKPRPASACSTRS